MANLIGIISFVFLFVVLVAVIIIGAVPVKKKPELKKDFPRGNRGRKVSHTKTGEQFVMIDGRLCRRFDK